MSGGFTNETESHILRRCFIFDQVCAVYYTVAQCSARWEFPPPPRLKQNPRCCSPQSVRASDGYIRFTQNALHNPLPHLPPRPTPRPPPCRPLRLCPPHPVLSPPPRLPGWSIFSPAAPFGSSTVCLPHRKSFRSAHHAPLGRAWLRTLPPADRSAPPADRARSSPPPLHTTPLRATKPKTKNNKTMKTRKHGVSRLKAMQSTRLHC